MTPDREKILVILFENEKKHLVANSTYLIMFFWFITTAVLIFFYIDFFRGFTFAFVALACQALKDSDWNWTRAEIYRGYTADILRTQYPYVPDYVVEKVIVELRRKDIFKEE